MQHNALIEFYALLAQINVLESVIKRFVSENFNPSHFTDLHRSKIAFSLTFFVGNAYLHIHRMKKALFVFKTIDYRRITTVS